MRRSSLLAVLSSLLLASLAGPQVAAADAGSRRAARPPRAGPRHRAVLDVQRLAQPRHRRRAGPRPVDARQRAGAERRRDHPAGAPRRAADQRVRLRPARRSTCSATTTSRWPTNGAAADRLPLRLHRAVQHRHPQRLRPQQQRHRRRRRRRLRVRRLPGPVRHGRLLEVPDRHGTASGPSSTSSGRTCRARCCPTTRPRPRPPTGTRPRSSRCVRLSRKSHWDLPIRIGRKTVHFLVSHPTPPVFDGPEDRNGTRNFDEIRFWADYVSPGRGALHVRRRRGAAAGCAAGARS